MHKSNLAAPLAYGLLLLDSVAGWASHGSIQRAYSTQLLICAQVLNFLGLFIIAGIGVDDSFLLFDVWKAEVDRGPSRTLPEILTASYRAAGASMAVTSISSAASFFTNALSLIHI